MRTRGVFLSPVGGHWRDLLEWRERVPELGFTIDTSHAALFRSFATVYPGLFAHPWDEELELGRYVEEAKVVGDERYDAAWPFPVSIVPNALLGGRA